jgi:hypothetical protein
MKIALIVIKIMMINAGAWYPRYNAGRQIWPRPHPRRTRGLSRRSHQVQQTVYIEDITVNK